MELVQHFTQQLQQVFHLPPQAHLLLAVSGGLDSVVLAHLCKTAGCKFSIAHCNFQLRGEESDRDEAFVRQLAAQYGAPIHVKHFDTAVYAEKEKLGIQEAARNLRYQWFHQLANEISALYIVTAHHGSDNVETVLMNFFKGTGIAGLRGMLPKNGRIIRPLLNCTRRQLENYAGSHGLQYVEDSSNASNKYSRNFLRNRVIPAVQEKYPQAEENIAAAIERYREVEMIYREAVEQKIKKLLVQKAAEWHIPVLKLRQQRPLHTLVYEIMAPFGFSPAQVPDIIHLLAAQTGKFTSSATHRVLKNRNWLIIAPLTDPAAQHVLVEEGEGQVWFENGTLQIEKLAGSTAATLTNADANTAWLNASQLVFPLLLRRWKAGDYFYPLGMKKKKKLARFFIDNKLSKTGKEKVWVLESDRKIIWVIGHRIDERAKVTNPQAPCIHINYRPAGTT